MIAGVLAFSSILAHATSTKTETQITEFIPALEQKIMSTMKAAGIPGVAVAIVSQDKVHYLKTFGVKRKGKEDKIYPTTLFQIASLSKPVNATLLAVLQDQGKLSLTDPVDRFVPFFQLRNNKKPVQICHLLSHSTGVRSNGFNEQIEAYIPRDQIVTKLQKTHPVAEPGKQFAYHNAMYGVAEDVISGATGKSLDRALKEELFAPLGMQGAGIGFHSMLTAPDKAYPHVLNNKGIYVPADDYSKAYYAFSAAGGVNASLLDLIPFLQLYLGKTSHIVSQETLKQLTEPYVKNNHAVILSEAKKGLISDTYYGLGWHSMKYADKKVVYHQGHLKGFRHFIGFVQDDVGIIILTNAEKRHASKIALKFFELYLDPKESPKK